MPSRVDFLHALISAHRAQGIQPAELHANRDTLNSFASEAKLTPVVQPDTRSPFERVVNRKAAPSPCLMFDGCKLVINERISGPAILIRPAMLMGDEGWLNKVMFHPHAKGPHGEQLIMPEGAETPWHQPADQAIAGVEGASPAPEGTMQALQQAGGASCTDVLVKAMEGMDKVEHVVVLRFYKNRDIDICSTMDRYAIEGGLRKAMMYVLGGD